MHKHKVIYASVKTKIRRNRAARLPFGARFDSNMAENGNAWVTRLYADNLSLFFSFLCLRLCLCLRRPGLYVRRKHKHKRMEIVPFSCACAYTCVVRVNRNDASIKTSTRRLCLRRTGLHAGFLCLRRTCKPGFRLPSSQTRHCSPHYVTRPEIGNCKSFVIRFYFHGFHCRVREHDIIKISLCDISSVGVNLAEVGKSINTFNISPCCCVL